MAKSLSARYDPMAEAEWIIVDLEQVLVAHFSAKKNHILKDFVGSILKPFKKVKSMTTAFSTNGSLIRHADEN